MSDDEDRLYLDLKGARERLCRAQTHVDPTDSGILQGAIDRIDLVTSTADEAASYVRGAS